MKKLFAILSVFVATGSCFFGVVLASSEAIRRTTFDSFPPESHWKIWLFLLVIPTILFFLAFRVWPRKEIRKENRLYLQLEKHLNQISYEDREVKL